MLVKIGQSFNELFTFDHYNIKSNIINIESNNMSDELPNNKKDDESADDTGVKIQSTQDFIVEQSWLFLTKITEAVANLSEAIQNRITDIGKVLAKNNVNYVHVVDSGSKVPVSPAKSAALKAQQAAGTSVS